MHCRLPLLLISQSSVSQLFALLSTNHLGIVQLHTACHNGNSLLLMKILVSVTGHIAQTALRTPPHYLSLILHTVL